MIAKFKRSKLALIFLVFFLASFVTLKEADQVTITPIPNQENSITVSDSSQKQ
jgi:hypothetical protein